MLAFSSCVYDYYPEEEHVVIEDVTLEVCFRLSARPGEMTKAPYPDGEGYVPGVGSENRVDVENGDYRIYFFDSGNVLIDRFEPEGFLAVEGSDYIDYTMLGKAPDGLVTHSDFKVVVLANWQKYKDEAMVPGTTTIDALCSADWAVFDCPSDFGADFKIPFYGVHTYNGISFESGSAEILDDPVALIRAMAKVEVILDYTKEEFQNVTLKDVEITRYNKTGYCAPTGVYSETDYVHGNWNDDYVQSLHLYDASAVGTGLKFHKQAGAGKETWVAYMPEYKNKGSNEYTSIDLKFSWQSDTEVPFKVYFAKYAGGITDNTLSDNRLDIFRNNLYRFTVNPDRTVVAEFIVEVDPFTPKPDQEIKM